MATSGTYNFYSSEQLVQFITEAFERLGFMGESVSGDMMTSAINSMNFMFMNWTGDKSRQWAIKLVNQTIVPGQASFQMPVGSYDILDMITRLNGIDIGMSQISRDEYLLISDKQVQSTQSVNYFVDKSYSPPVVFLYPIPLNTTQGILYNAMMVSPDVNDVSLMSGTTPYWNDAIAAGLCERLAEKFKPEIYLEKVAVARETYQRASRADGDLTDARIRTPYKFG
jgi:hypothetical protein